MGSRWPLETHLIFITIVLVATTYTCSGAENSTMACSTQERAALLKFKHNVKDYFDMLSSWVGHDCCRWERVGCNGVTGNVESLHLRGVRNPISTSGWYYGVRRDYYMFGKDYYLIGNEVSSSLADLKHLKYLDLSGNDFFGSKIPDFIGTLKQLRYLNISNAELYGNIPHQIGNLSNLKVLDLSSPYQRLTVDDMAWISGLSSLEYLDLRFVDLSRAKNSDMVLYMIPSLQDLTLSGCGLSNTYLGHFRNSSTTLSNIKHLDLSYNSFKGNLPRFVRNMTSLAFLDLSYYNLSLASSVVDLLNMIPSLSELHLSGCGIDNTHLSIAHFNVSKLYNIQHLVLKGNLIGGNFPSAITNMSSLQALDLSRNMINSSIPIMPNLLNLDLSSNEFKHIEHLGIWRQCHLKQLSLSNNLFDIQMIDSRKNVSECSQYALERLHLDSNFNGTIPEFLGRLTNLKELDLSNSGLIGSIPESLGRLRLLQVLDLAYNHLTGPIPIFLGKLIEINLSTNQLNGSVPDFFGRLETLKDLILESNRLTGSIPASLGRLRLLEAFSVSSNLLNGSIPYSFGQLSRLKFLDISNNSLQGVVSETHFSRLSMLKHIDVSSNGMLTFNISREWIPPFQLKTLHLSSCKIEGGFPHWLRTQRKLQMLWLSNATISGPLPTWFRTMPIIPILDLSYNKLCGPLKNLPDGGTSSVVESGSIKALLLQNNLFNESIPRSLCRNIYLEFLNLSRNRLTGEVPKCMEDLRKLWIVILNSNRLSGVFPSSIISNSLSLEWVTLNDNNFIGDLPQGLRNLQDLKVLDLGGNEFYGNIPSWIGEELTSLVVLSLHKNNFSGRIFRSICKISNLKILDFAHNNLIGPIPHCLGELNVMVNGSETDFFGEEFDESVTQVIKGVYLEYKTTLDLVYNMDLSSNKLVGEIPVELTSLSKLVGLNLSNNHLVGSIPYNIGNMKELNSLDFSRNELNGTIPSSIATLTFLSHLNLSNNNLWGRIPTGSQLQTLQDPSIYAGNKDLCGAPLKNCSTREDPRTTPKNKIKEHDVSNKVWLFYLDIMCGFATGFWGVVGVLWFKKEWRNNLFVFAEVNVDKIYVAFVAGFDKMKRGREST